MIYRWMGMADGDTGEPLYLSHSSDKTVQIYGTFGSGGSVTIQGSNNKASEEQTYATLHKIDLSALTYTAAGIDVIIDNPIAIRPSVTAGDENTSLNVILCCCKTIK
jgi:hypothetical protein